MTKLSRKLCDTGYFELSLNVIIWKLIKLRTLTEKKRKYHFEVVDVWASMNIIIFIIFFVNLNYLTI